jgi:hypothetical protein
MSQKLRAEYLSCRRRFEPASVNLVIVAESPPVSGRYFYDVHGAIGEPLFRALMKQLGIEPKTKDEGLRAFQDYGWVLVDATYEQVNAHDKRGRDGVVERDYPQLRDDLKQLLTDRWKEVPLVLLKANVCALLEPRLTKDGFKVLNNGQRVYFPSHGRQNDFDRQFGAIVKSATI